MFIFILAIVLGLVVLVFSADKFVDGASSLASYYGLSPLLIGMVIIGFGTSAPEMMVSALASLEGSPGIALGNAYGSNIANISLILGVTAFIFPITVHSNVLRKELPILFFITIVSIGALVDLKLTRIESIILLVLFSGFMMWTIVEGLSNKGDALGSEVNIELKTSKIPVKKSYFMVLGGILFLILSSRALVYGAVGIAKIFGVTDIVIGLTIVAVGTSLPELASSIVAAKKGEADIALGNVLGSNFFNTLFVVGLAGVIHPLKIDEDVFYRDIGFMTFLTFLLFIFGYGFKKKGKINKWEGLTLVILYIVYTTHLIGNSII